MKPIEEKYKKDRTLPTGRLNRPSKIYMEKVGDMMYFEDDRYCGGHKSNGRYHKKMSRVLRSKIKAETKQMIENAEDE